MATESPAASRVARRVLERGGNAVDAAVSAVFAVNVARPQSCGIGGGGFMVYRSAGGRLAALDFRETAPAALPPDAFQGEGIYRTFTGHKTVGVPGTLAGMRAALRRYGTLTLAQAIAPSERLARNGVRVEASLSRAMADNAPRLRMFRASAKQFLIDGAAPYPPGSTLVQPRLARTLRGFMREGTGLLYRGEIGRRIVDDMRRANDYPGDEGLLTMDDLARYRAKWRTPLLGRYRGHRIIAMPAPTSGGIATIEMLNILEGYNMRGFGQSSADALHFLAESQKIAFADRGAYVADPDYERVPQRELTSKSYAERRRAEINPWRARSSYPPGNPSGTTARAAGGGDNLAGTTTHISVIDARGNAVALTCTIEAEFGSAVVAPGTGFLLNNEMTDFGSPGTANEIEPGKRPRSSMSPTIVQRRGRPVLVVGGAGGARIIMGSLLATVNTIDYGLDVARAVDAERIDALRGQPIELEDARVSDAVEAELIARGHQIDRRGEYAIRPRVQAAGVDLRSGLRLAISDPRTDFAALTQRRPAGRR